MRFYEFEAKRLLAKHGIPIPESRAAESAADAERAASAIGYPVLLKAQVLARAQQDRDVESASLVRWPPLVLYPL